MKVLLASATYGPVMPECSASLLAAVMTAGVHGIRWVGCNIPDRLGFMDARNNSVEVLADGLVEADGIMWVDSDMLPQPGQIWELLAKAERGGYDFYTGLYHQRRGEFKPCFYQWDEKLQRFRQNLIYQPGQIERIGACGFGFVYTSTKLLRAIEALPHFSREKGGWFPDHRYTTTSEDMGFCKLARDTGTPLILDSNIIVDHLGGIERVGREQYLKALGGSKGILQVQMG